MALGLAAAGVGALSGAAAACVGDCDNSGRVTVDEVVAGVNIALEIADAATCRALDCAGEGRVTVECLIGAVKASLGGCAASVPAPLVEGPITAGNGAFVAATTFDPSLVGYETAEYFISGTARAFRAAAPPGPDGRWLAQPGDDRSAYRTRLVVYRPSDPARFNGTVVVEWLNVSGGLDAAPDWTYAHTELTREGYAWVGVSAQKVGVEGGAAIVGVISLPLKTIDPVRYGSLSHPGDSFSYDIFSQAAQAVRNPDGIRPLGALAPARVIAAGESQSAFRMVTYINAVHGQARVFDGYLVHSRGSIGAPLSEAPQTAMPVPGTAPVRDDLDVPTLIFQTETDLTLLGYFGARQPDSASVRLWEVAGTAHVDAYQLVTGPTDLGTSPAAFEPLVISDPIPGLVTCEKPINDGPHHVVLKAAFAALDRWVRDGTPPPVAPRLEVRAGPPVAIFRDSRGNALGGIRTPAVDVPIATLSGDGQESSLLCALFGTTVPFAPAVLAELYPTAAAYEAAFAEATDDAVAAGFIRPADAALMKAAAAGGPGS